MHQGLDRRVRMSGRNWVLSYSKELIWFGYGSSLKVPFSGSLVPNVVVVLKGGGTFKGWNPVGGDYVITTLLKEGINAELTEWVRSYKSALFPKKAGCYKRVSSVPPHSLAFTRAHRLFALAYLSKRSSSDASVMISGLSSHQNHELNKPLFFMHYPASRILL